MWLYAQHYLLQECYELAGTPLVRLRQVYIFKVDNESLGVPGSIDTPSVGRDDHADLVQLLDYVSSRGLGTAVDDGHLGRAELVKAVAEEQFLATPIWAYQQERLHAVTTEPWTEHAETLLHCRSQDDWKVVTRTCTQVSHCQTLWNLQAQKYIF